MFSSMATITSEAWTNQCPKNVNTYLHTYLVSFKTLIGSPFPLLPLRVKCQNHERVPISPILVVYVFSSCQDMDHQNRGNRDPLMVLPGWTAKTMRGSLFPLLPLRVKCQNHERVPISPISPISMFWWHVSSTSRSYHNFLYLLTWSCWSSSYYLTSYSEFTPCELKLSSSCL